MMTTTRKLKGLVVRATDGELGTVEDFYFDDETWGVRYLTLETGGWLGGRQVLISPIAVLQTDWSARRIDVKLTRRQIENSPSIDKHKPVSRQHEAQYMTYYGYPYYWDGPYLWGAAYYPTGLMMDPMAHSQQTLEDRAGKDPGDSHLRSTDEVTGYHIHANDGEIGHVDQFVIDDEVWAIRYLEVATRNWWPGKKVLLSPSWVERVSWPASSVFVALSRKAIQTCPEYFEGMEITREYEKNIYCHYGRPPYWLNESENRPSVSSPTR